MPRIVLARDLKHEQIEFPKDLPAPEGRRGGDKSSLHLRHGSVRDVSQEELDYIRDNRPEVFRCLDVLPEPRVPSRVARKLARAQASAQAASRLPEGAPGKAPRGSGKAPARKSGSGASSASKAKAGSKKGSSDAG